MRWAEATVAAVILAAGAAHADYVTDPAMCGVDAVLTLEDGLRLDATSMWAIEYTCEWDGAVDFTSNAVQVRPGYCSEPGLLFPTLFAFQVGAEGPGTLWVHEGDSGEPQRFFACSK